MKKLIKRSILTVACLGFVIGITLWLTLRRYNLQHVRLPPAAVDEVVDRLASLNEAIERGKVPSRKVDFHSVGSPEVEAQLLDLRHWIEVYEVSFGKLPERSSDLERMNEKGSLKSAQKRSIKKVARKCQIFAFGSDSYLLNCDGWRTAEDRNLESLIERFDTGTEKFYVAGGHVFLYAPPSKEPVGNLETGPILELAPRS